MLTGCVPYGILLIILLGPQPGMTSNATAIWFGMSYIMFYLLGTYCNIPYDSLGPELTDNYEDRNRLFFISGLFDGIGSLLGIMSPISCVPSLVRQMFPRASVTGGSDAGIDWEHVCFMEHQIIPHKRQPTSAIVFAWQLHRVGLRFGPTVVQLGILLVCRCANRWLRLTASDWVSFTLGYASEFGTS